MRQKKGGGGGGGRRSCCGEGEHDGMVLLRPNENDVLCGRGKTRTAHVGNLRFRALVYKHVEQYQGLRGKTEQRVKLCRAVVLALQDLQPPGRFLDFDEMHQEWYEIPAQAAIGKTRKVFSDAVRKAGFGYDHHLRSALQDAPPPPPHHDAAAAASLVNDPAMLTTDEFSRRLDSNFGLDQIQIDKYLGPQDDLRTTSHLQEDDHLLQVEQEHSQTTAAAAVTTTSPQQGDAGRRQSRDTSVPADHGDEADQDLLLRGLPLPVEKDSPASSGAPASDDRLTVITPTTHPTQGSANSNVSLADDASKTDAVVTTHAHLETQGDTTTDARLDDTHNHQERSLSSPSSDNHHHHVVAAATAPMTTPTVHEETQGDTTLDDARLDDTHNHQERSLSSPSSANRHHLVVVAAAAAPMTTPTVHEETQGDTTLDDAPLDDNHTADQRSSSPSSANHHHHVVVAATAPMTTPTVHEETQGDTTLDDAPLDDNHTADERSSSPSSANHHVVVAATAPMTTPTHPEEAQGDTTLDDAPLDERSSSSPSSSNHHHVVDAPKTTPPVIKLEKPMEDFYPHTDDISTTQTINTTHTSYDDDDEDMQDKNSFLPRPDVVGSSTTTTTPQTTIHPPISFSPQQQQNLLVMTIQEQMKKQDKLQDKKDPDGGYNEIDFTRTPPRKKRKYSYQTNIHHHIKTEPSCKRRQCDPPGFLPNSYQDSKDYPSNQPKKKSLFAKMTSWVQDIFKGGDL